MDKQLDSILKRGRGYWLVDGFVELIAGILFLLLGGLVLWRGLTAQDSFSLQIGALVGDVAILKLCGLVTGFFVLWWLKDRFTYPRTGFVRGKRPSAVQIMSFLRNAILLFLLLSGGSVAAFLLIPVTRGVLFATPVWVPVGLGVFWAVVCSFAGQWMGLRRFQVLSACILAAGIATGIWQAAMGLSTIPPEVFNGVTWANLPGNLQSLLADVFNRTTAGLGLLTLMTGIAFLATGLVTFLRYRKENPVPVEEAE